MCLDSLMYSDSDISSQFGVAKSYLMKELLIDTEPLGANVIDTKVFGVRVISVISVRNQLYVHDSHSKFINDEFLKEASKNSLDVYIFNVIDGEFRNYLCIKSILGVSYSERIKNVSELIGIVSELDSSSDYKWYFRGHNNISYKLEPSLYRGISKDVVHSKLVEKEIKLYRDVRLRCPSYFSGHDSYFDSLSKMQHYRLKTRLLDVTTNPLVALYFACVPDENSKNDKVINDGEVLLFRAHRDKIKYDDDVNLNIKKLRKVDDSLPVDVEALSMTFVKPKLDNPRIIMQSGAFILFETVLREPDKFIGYSIRLRIDGCYKESILKQLAMLSISKSTLFPELDVVASVLSESFNDWFVD